MLHGVKWQPYYTAKFENNVWDHPHFEHQLQRSGSPSHPHFWQLQLWGVPKTTLNFCTFLEKLIDLIESCYSYSYGLLQWKYRLNSAKGRDGWGRVWKSSLLRASSCLLPVESQMTLTFLATICDTMYRVLSLRESQPILGIQRFFSGLSLIDLADHPTWLTSVSSHLGDWADIVDPKFHPKSQC